MSGRGIAAATLAAIVMLAPASPARAQPAPLVVGGAPANVLRAGTPIQLETLTELTTEGKHLKVGDRFELATTDPVQLGGATVIPPGSRGVGEITSVRNKGMWGKSGGITAHILYIEANGRQMRVSGSFDDRGVTGTGGVVASVILVPVVGFFVTGTSARIAPHSHVKAFLDEDLPVTFAASTAPTPMVVAAPTSAGAGSAAKPVPAVVATPAVAATVAPASVAAPAPMPAVTSPAKPTQPAPTPTPVSVPATSP